MRKFKNHSVKEYLDELSLKVPVPGGGSAAALAGALGAALISMVANYSLGKNKSKTVDQKIKKLLKESERLRKRLIELVDLDAQAYLGVVKTRKSAPAIRKKALKRASQVPRETARLCYQGVLLAPYLVEKGNKYLLSDVEVALELLRAAYNSAMVNVETNQ